MQCREAHRLRFSEPRRTSPTQLSGARLSESRCRAGGERLDDGGDGHEDDEAGGDEPEHEG